MAQEKTIEVYRTPAAVEWGRRVWRRLRDNSAVVLILTAAIIIWEALVVLLRVPEYLLPTPSAIAAAMVAKRNILLWHAGWTLSEVLLGYLLALAVAIPMGILIVYWKLAEKTLYAFLVSSQAVPKVALAPLLIAWFGFSQEPKIIVAFLICFFPIVVSTEVGLRAMPVDMFHLARSLGATKWETFWKFNVPYALPSIFAGLKVAITLAVVGAVVGEYTAGHNGLGYYQEIVAANLQTPLVFATLVLLALMGNVLFYLMEAIESWAVRWAPSQQIERVQQI